jgi:hypothetical protein
MTIIYKGASPNTHWHTNTPISHGRFTAAGQNLPQSADRVVAHITQSSRNSPFISFTYSFAVAVQYALDGATVHDPGFVYEIDTASIKNPLIYDPIMLLHQNHSAIHKHDGGQDLIIGIASPVACGHILFNPPTRPTGSPAIPPNVSANLAAIINAIRDAELLLPSFSIDKNHISVHAIC